MIRKTITTRYPSYYPSFSCIGSRCEDTCCASWQVGADPASLRRYRSVKGEFGKWLRGSIDWSTGSFLLRDGRCPFLNEENLCEMYLRLGEDSLCRTCRDFPRHLEDYGRLREVSLSLACPEAARLILGQEDGGGFYTKRRILEERRSIPGRGKQEKREDGEPDEAFLGLLLAVRETFYRILESPGEEDSIWLKMSRILALSHDVQRRITKGGGKKAEDVEALLARYTSPEAPKRFEIRLKAYLDGGVEACSGAPETARRHPSGARQHLMCLWMEQTSALEPVSAEWRALAGSCIKGLFAPSVTAEEYRVMHRRFTEIYSEADRDLDRLLRYYLYVYVPGAVYDGDLYSKVKMAVFSCLLIREVSVWMARERGTFDRASSVHISHLWARELEHSDDNLEKTERLMRGHQAFRSEPFLICLNPEFAGK